VNDPIVRARRSGLSGLIVASALWDGAAEEGVLADLIILALLIFLRAGTLLMGALQVTGSSSRLTHPAAAGAALIALAGESVLVLGLAGVRISRRLTPALGGWVAVIESVAGVASLLVVAYATPPALRVTPTFWIETYTVISAVIIVAATQRVILGAAGAVCLTLTYLLSVFVVARGGASLSSAARATAWTNALSYLPFFAVGAIGFTLLRSVVAQTDDLRRLVGRLSAERARIEAAKEAHDIGHDLPKGLLRQVHRGLLSTDKLRPWAEEACEELSGDLQHDRHPPLGLREALTKTYSPYLAAMTLQVNIEALGEAPNGAPTLTIAGAVRELLSNASFHAYGFPVTLTAESSAERVQVTVHNDGPGVEPAMLESTWALKQNALHQLEAAGGRYKVHSSTGSPTGTTITLSWPTAGH
jgi:hypothetical protein